MKKLVLVLILALCLPVLVLAQTKTIGCEFDATIQDIYPTLNFGSDTTLWAGYQDADASINRAVLAFNVSGGTPDEGWTSDSAKLKIRGTTEITTTNYYVYIYTLFREFTESQVTWNNAETGVPWTTAGGDYNSSPKDSFLFTAPHTTYTVKLSSAMSETIETCVNTNRIFYIELINKTEEVFDSRKTFSSDEGGQPCTLFVYGNTALSQGSPPPPTAPVPTPNAMIIYHGSTNVQNAAMDFPFYNMAVKIPNKDSLVVCWQNGNDTGTTIDGLVYAWSSDSGATWSVPKQINSSTTVRGSMVAVGDTVYCAVGTYNSTTNGNILVYKFVPGGTPSQIGTGTTTGDMPNMTYQSGDTFWLSYPNFNTTGATTERCSLLVDYSTNRGVNWTNSLRRVLSSRSVNQGRNQILHTSGNRLVIVATGIVNGVEGNLTLHWRNDADSKTTWKNKVDVDTNEVGWTAGAYLTPLDSNVIIHYAQVQNGYDSTFVKVWRNSDSSLVNQTKVWDATGWAAGKRVYNVNIGYAGDTIFALTCPTATGVNDNIWTQIIQYKKSANGTTWVDSTRIAEPPENGFAAVWKNANGTWTDYTTAANNNTANDLSFFGVNTDTLFFGHSVKYNYIHFVEGTAQANGAQTLSWKYWNGSTWATLTLGLSEPYQDSFFTTSVNLATHQVWFGAPADWETTTVNGTSGKYWIKLSTSAAYAAAVVMSSVSSAIWQTVVHTFRQNPSNYLWIAYVRGGREALNTGDVMFAKYLLVSPPVGEAVKNARRERLIRIGGG